MTYKAKAGTIDGGDEDDARAIASRMFPGNEIISCKELPYPAIPYIHDMTGTPTFCWAPGTCQGRTACPRNPSCTE